MLKYLFALRRCLLWRHKPMLALLHSAAMSLFFALTILAPAIMTSGQMRANERKSYEEGIRQDSLQAVADSLLADSIEQAVADSLDLLFYHQVCVEQLLTEAKTHIGASYRTGRSGPNAFDCSGFTCYVFSKMGVKLSRSSRTQFLEGEAVTTTDSLAAGDLVFFSGRGGGKYVGHVGIVTDVDSVGGGFRFIHATRTGVQIDNSEAPYYSHRYIGARRITI